MSRALRAILAGSVVVTLGGCVEPEVMSANERGGIIKHANGTNEAAAFSLADSYCHQFGRVAQITGTDVIYNNVMFACLAK